MSQEQDDFKDGLGKKGKVLDAVKPATTTPDTKPDPVVTSAPASAAVEDVDLKKKEAAAESKRRNEISFTRYLESISSERDPEKMVFIDKDGEKKINKVGFEADLSTLSRERNEVEVTAPVLRLFQFLMMLIGFMSRSEYDGVRERDRDNAKRQLQAKAEAEGKNQGFLVPLNELQLNELQSMKNGEYMEHKVSANGKEKILLLDKNAIAHKEDGKVYFKTIGFKTSESEQEWMSFKTVKDEMTKVLQEQRADTSLAGLLATSVFSRFSMDMKKGDTPLDRASAYPAQVEIYLKKPRKGAFL